MGRRAHIVDACVLYSLSKIVHCLARQSKVSVGVLFEEVLIIFVCRSIV
jgi:hypothetical protein